jgi:heme/copper-type cytochrome/quinol oxidase subunit 2
MNRFPLANRALALPLIGLVFTWWFFMMATLAEIYIPNDLYDMNGQITYHYEGVTAPPYLYLIGIAVFTVSALIAQGWAMRALEQEGENDALARSAYRFSNLGLVLGLGASTIFAIGNFMGGFNSYGPRADSLVVRFFNLYAPIILATALVVTVILRAFVFRAGHAEEKTESGKPKLSDAQKALALGYATPILATTVAIILGLFVYDVTKTNLQTWVWVIIIAIVGAGIILGTRFANKARAAKPAPPKPRTALAAGAATLNFVLSIVFGGAVSLMGFTLGSEAVNKLRVWDNGTSQKMPEVSIKGVTWEWLFQEIAPAKILILLAAIGIYLSITERNRKAVSK